MANLASLKLTVGDRVVYPNQGLCKVTAIDAKEVLGQKLVMVSLLREEDGAKVMVPEAKVVAIGVRKVASGSDVNKVIDFIRSDSDKASLDWKARARTNVERMANGGLLGLAEVVKGLQVLSELRPLPTKERDLYNDARHLLVAELAASMSVLEADAEDTIDALLFPVGKERPKRTAEEFRSLAGGEDDELGLDGDLMGDLDEVPEDEAESAAASSDSDESGESEDGGDEEEAEKPAKKAKKEKKPAVPKATKAPAASKSSAKAAKTKAAPAAAKRDAKPKAAKPAAKAPAAKKPKAAKAASSGKKK